MASGGRGGVAPAPPRAQEGSDEDAEGGGGDGDEGLAHIIYQVQCGPSLPGANAGLEDNIVDCCARRAGDGCCEDCFEHTEIPHRE